LSLHGDLRYQARHLATREPKRPRQASLRRAISSAYYALFHLLVNDASRFMVAGNTREPLRQCLGRAFAHHTMKTVARQFANGTYPTKLRPALQRQPLPRELGEVAQAFVDLQQARHEADYDTARRFTRAEAIDLVDQCDQAFANWQTVRGKPSAEAFMVGLLAHDNMKR